MSTFIYPNDYTSFVGREAKRVPKKLNREKIRKLLIFLIILFASIALFQIIWSFFVLPNMSLQNLQIISETDFPEDPMKVKAVTGLDAGVPYPDIDPKRIRTLLLDNLMIEDAVVEKRFPDRVIIRLRERIPVAISLFETKDNRTVPLLLDREGVVIGAGLGVDYFDLPVLSGDFKMPLPVLGEQVDESQEQLLKKLDEIKNEEEELYKLISEVELKGRGSESFDLLLYIRGHSMPLMLKQNFTPQRLLRGISVMDALKDVGYDQSFKMIDYRSDYLSFEKRDGGLYGS